MNTNEKIKKLRERFYLTQEGFGKLLSISEKEIDDLENGVIKPNNKQIKKIEEIFRISLKDSDIDDSVNLMVVEMNDTISFLGFCDNIIDDIYFWWNIDECLCERVNLNQENKLERGTYYILEKDGIHILVTLDGTKAYVELINGSTETSFVVNGFSYSREEMLEESVEEPKKTKTPCNNSALLEIKEKYYLKSEHLAKILQVPKETVIEWEKGEDCLNEERKAIFWNTFFAGEIGNLYRDYIVKKKIKNFIIMNKLYYDKNLLNLSERIEEVKKIKLNKIDKQKIYEDLTNVSSKELSMLSKQKNIPKNSVDFMMFPINSKVDLSYITDVIYSDWKFYLLKQKSTIIFNKTKRRIVELEKEENGYKYYLLEKKGCNKLLIQQSRDCIAVLLLKSKSRSKKIKMKNCVYIKEWAYR